MIRTPLLLAAAALCGPALAKPPQKQPAPTATPRQTKSFHEMIREGKWSGLSADTCENGKEFPILRIFYDMEQLEAEAALRRGPAGGISEAIQAGQDLVFIGDKMAAIGCPVLARKLYLEVIDTYTGTAYGAVRQRAQIGIDDLRVAAETKVLPQSPTSQQAAASDSLPAP